MRVIGGLVGFVAVALCAGCTVSATASTGGAEEPGATPPEELVSRDDEEQRERHARDERRKKHHRKGLPRDIVRRSALPWHGVRLADGTALARDDVLRELSEAAAICVGEQHDNPHDHYAQLAVLDGILDRAEPAGREVGLGFEMVRKPEQKVLDRLARGNVSLRRFPRASRWRESWGYDFALYRPLFARGLRGGATLLALNAPKALTRDIARGGLRSLSDEQREQLPALDLRDPDHRAWFDEQMGAHPVPSHGVDHFYAAQVVWDETMAQTAAAWIAQRAPARQIVIIAGNGHCWRAAIPARIERRIDGPALAVRPVIVRGDEQPDVSKERFDYAIVMSAEQ